MNQDGGSLNYNEFVTNSSSGDIYILFFCPTSLIELPTEYTKGNRANEIAQAFKKRTDNKMIG